jgi:hypothetical protein
MHYGRYVYESELARRYFGAGIERGRKEAGRATRTARGRATRARAAR